MKLENIKTRTEFYEFADIWYQRGHRLREVWQDENETAERKEKAFRLCIIMKSRAIDCRTFRILTNLQDCTVVKNKHYNATELYTL